MNRRIKMIKDRIPVKPKNGGQIMKKDHKCQGWVKKISSNDNCHNPNST